MAWLGMARSRPCLDHLHRSKILASSSTPLVPAAPAAAHQVNIGDHHPDRRAGHT